MRSSPGSAPRMPASKPGIMLSLPSVRRKPSALPPSNGTSSIEPSKSITTWSPSAAALGVSGAAYLAREIGRQTLDAAVDARLVGQGGQAGQLDGVEIDRRHLGQHLEAEAELQILALVERGDLDLGPERRLQAVAVDRLPRALVDRLLQHLAHDRAAVLLLQQRQRRLAGPEAGQPDGLHQLLQPGLHPLLDLSGRDDDPKLALQPVGGNLRDLHCPESSLRSAGSSRRRPWLTRCTTRRGAGGENSELAQLAPREPKSRVSTGSTTPARRGGRI